jgi:cytoskeleton protein RodZ
MQSVGSTIRTARLQSGISLEQVSAKTRISIKNLQAIENDDVAQFSSAFLYKSFAGQFAREVKVYDELAPLIHEAVSSIPEPVLPGQCETVIEKAALPPVERPRFSRWLRPLASLTVVLLTCSGLYTVWENWKPQLKRPSVQPIAAVKKPAASADNSIPVQPEDGFQVEISGIERSWLALAADGRQIFSGFLEADQTKILRGHEVGRIRTGNAGGVSLVFNGKPIGVAGPRGQIRTVVFTKDNYQVLTPLHAASANDTASGEWMLLPASHPVFASLPLWPSVSSAVPE